MSVFCVYVRVWKGGGGACVREMGGGGGGGEHGYYKYTCNFFNFLLPQVLG